MGNRTAEKSYDPSNTLHWTHSRVYNSLSQLYQDINAAGTAAVTTTFGYDSNGNQTSIAAPLSCNTGSALDELNRLRQITDPGTGVTQLGYDFNLRFPGQCSDAETGASSCFALGTPFPIANFRHVLSKSADVSLVLNEFVLHLLLEINAGASGLRKAIDDIRD